MPRFGGCLHFLIRPSCCCYACFNAAPLPPPLGLWAKRRLKALRISPPRRSSFCYTLPLLDEPALHAQLCRFLNTSEPLARFLRCQRPFVSLRWASYATMQRQVAFETTHPTLLLPSPATPFPPPSSSPNIHHSLSGYSLALPVRATSLAKSILGFRTVISHSQVLAECRASACESMW